MSNYIQEKQGELWKKQGAFFAFSSSQFNEKRVQGVEYVSIRSLCGLICPKENAEYVIKETVKIHQEGMKKEIEEKGKEQIIIDELYNRECFYTRDIDDAVEALEPYGITAEEVLEQYNKIKEGAIC